MTQISVYGADHSLFQSLLNFLNFARGLYALTLNSEQTIETDHDSSQILSWKTVKVTVTTLLSTTCLAVLALNFLCALSFFLTAEIVFGWSLFCLELIVVKLSLIELLCWYQCDSYYVDRKKE